MTLLSRPILTQAFGIDVAACAAAGFWSEAEAHFEAAGRQAREFPNRIDGPQVLHWHAKMLLDRGDPDDRDRARTMLGDALASYRKLGMPLLADYLEDGLEALGIDVAEVENDLIDE